MSIGSISLPRPPDSPLGFSSFSGSPTPAQATQSVGGITTTIINNLGSTVIAEGGVPFTVRRSITNAELAALNGTPIQILPAPGAGFRWIVLFASLSTIKTVASGGPAPNLRLRWQGIGVDLTTALSTDLANAPRSFFSQTGSPFNSLNSTANGTIDNLPLMLDASSGIGTSNGTCTLDVVVMKQPVPTGTY